MSRRDFALRGSAGCPGNARLYQRKQRISIGDKACAAAAIQSVKDDEMGIQPFPDGLVGRLRRLERPRAAVRRIVAVADETIDQHFPTKAAAVLRLATQWVTAVLTKRPA